MNLLKKFRAGAVNLLGCALVLFLATAAWGQEAASSSSAGAAGSSSASAAEAPSPSSVAPQYTNGGYTLQPNDLIRITVFEEDDLTTETRISKSGVINFPLIGSVRVAGRTVDDATAEIRERLDKDYIVNPQVTLVLVEFAKQWVTVLGEVQKPGQVEIPAEGGLDLLGAIALAGGYTRIADPAHVIVRRQVDGKDRVLRVNAKQLSRDSRVQQFEVLPGDTINVGQSFF